jgi:PAS domain S-box-containing protein
MVRLEGMELLQVVRECFGRNHDPIEVVAERVERQFAGPSALVWEGNAQTFEFSYVSPNAEKLLGYPVSRWTCEPTFWADVVIAPDDRDDAIAYCALATAKRADHVFEYRARHAHGEIVWLRDYVRVIVGSRGIARTLRGIMLDVSEEKRADRTYDARATYREPTRAALSALR